MGPAESALLAAAEQSLDDAAAQYHPGWVGLFTTDGRVEDPIGSWLTRDSTKPFR
jgi:hypothetical protein